MKTFIFTSLSCFILLGFLNSASAATTYISTANGTTTIVSNTTAGTYAPGDAIQVSVAQITTDDPYVTNVSLTGDGTTIYNGGVPVYNVTTTVGTAGAPQASVDMTLVALVTMFPPGPESYYLEFNCESFAAGGCQGQFVNTITYNLYTVNAPDTSGSVEAPSGEYEFIGGMITGEPPAQYRCPIVQELRTTIPIGTVQYIGPGQPVFSAGIECH